MTYLAMPQQLKRMIDNEFASGNLLSYDQLRNFLAAFSDSDTSTKGAGPPPLTIASVTSASQGSNSPHTQAVPVQQPQEQPREYTDEEWFAYALKREGHKFCQDMVDDPTVARIIAAMCEKGKGKGNAGATGQGIWTNGRNTCGQPAKGRGKGTGKTAKFEGIPTKISLGLRAPGILERRRR